MRAFLLIVLFFYDKMKTKKETIEIFHKRILPKHFFCSLLHIFSLVPNNKNIVIIDDSYSANEEGVKSAMEVLDNFKGRKIVLTPGLVELGKVENLVNFEFGKTLAKHADFVIVVGKHNAEMIIKGLIEGGMEKEKIAFAKNLNKGNAILNEMLMEGDVVLFENDLPDNYN